jgi:hypothetical protein
VTPGTFMTGLYPPGIRQRWGAEISREVAESGVRSWPDTVVGAIRLWLHPNDWPETYAGQTRRVLAVLAFVVTAVTGLGLRAAQPVPGWWLVPIGVGLALAAPIPRLRWPVLRRLAAAALRTLATPAAAVATLFLIAHSGLVDQPAGLVRVVLLAYYWSTLGFVAYRSCALVAHVAAMPGARRLRAGLLLIGAGLALAAGQSLVGGSVGVAAALALLASATIHIGHSVRQS